MEQSTNLLLLRTLHGSHLYGLAHGGSDLDYYSVVSRASRGNRKKCARQTINAGLDEMVLDLSTFRNFCDEGVPQALEALFAPEPEVDLLTDFRANYMVDTARAVRTYKRTAHNFSMGNLKQKRHALRLALNLYELLETGRFNPTLSTEEASMITHMARSNEFFFHFHNMMI